MTVAQKGMALVAVPLLFQFAFLLAVVRLQREQTEAEGWAAHTKDVIARGRAIHATVSDAHASVRGYVITRDPALAAPFHQARSDLPHLFDEFEALVRDNPDQVARSTRLRATADALVGWQGRVVVLVRDGAGGEAVAEVRTGEGNAALDAFRQEAEALLDAEELLAHERAAVLAGSRARMNAILVAGAGLAVVTAVALAHAFRRVIGRRFSALEDTARRLTAGEAPLPPLGGNDEIATIDRALRAMATGLTRATDEVRQLNAGLEARVRERTVELEAANRDLAQKNSENEMFVYSVSHDLRSPLVNLQGFSKELEKGSAALSAAITEEGVPSSVRDRCRTILDGKMAKSVGFIQAAVLRLSGIIDALLRLSRAGRVEYRWEVVDVAGAAARVVSAAQGTIAERRAVVRVGPVPPAWGDRAAVEQLLGNLIGNALKYLDPTRPGEVEVGCVPAVPPGTRTYYVRDNGLGIPVAHQARIFQAFQRAHPEVGTGEGLGLAIVARIAERHRGRVWVESAPGTGSTFFVSLPAPPGAG